MDDRMRESLDVIFKPQSIAVVGASNNPRRWGYATLRNILLAGYRHRVYPINPTERAVQGLPAYSSLSAVPEEIDLAVIVVNASVVETVVRECIARKIKGGIVITAGFAELGPAGAESQKRLAEEARDAGFYFIGPNCWGIWSSAGSVNTIFSEQMLPPRGPISFISQSGTLGEYFYNATQKCGFGMSKFVSCGNQASITFTDLVEYLADDPATRVITGYLEDVMDGRRFLDAARAAAAKKPLLIYKAGASQASARAARSHTAAMAGSDEVFDAACRQAGVIRWHDFMEMFDMADALCHQPLPRGNRVGVVSTGGGFCVTAAESCSRMGLELPEMNAEAQAELREQMQAFSPPPVNPVDAIGRKTNEAYLKIIEIVAQQETIDGLILTPRLGRFDRRVSAEDMVEFIRLAEGIAAIPERFEKPVILANEHELSGPAYEIFKRSHIPFFDNPADCATAMYGLVKYAQIKGRFRT
jgi:acyl-CoA synthetase (NDP forming)